MLIPIFPDILLAVCMWAINGINGATPNGRFIVDHPTKMDDFLGYPNSEHLHMFTIIIIIGEYHSKLIMKLA